eukprot:EG_transcript_12020
MLRRLQVEVHEAQGLPPGEAAAAGKPSLFVMVSCGREHWRTTAKPGLQDHTWNESHSFAPAPFIHVRVMDEAKAGKEDILGQGRVELTAELLRRLQAAEARSLWVDLALAGRAAGRVRLTLGAEFEKAQPNGGAERPAELSRVTPTEAAANGLRPSKGDKAGDRAHHRSRSHSHGHSPVKEGGNVALARKLREEIELEKAEHDRLRRRHEAELAPLQVELQKAKAELEAVIQEVNELQHAPKGASRRRQRSEPPAPKDAPAKDAGPPDLTHWAPANGVQDLTPRPWLDWPGQGHRAPAPSSATYTSPYVPQPAFHSDYAQRPFPPPPSGLPSRPSPSFMPVPLPASTAYPTMTLSGPYGWPSASPSHTPGIDQTYSAGYLGPSYPSGVRTQRALTLH